MSRRRRANPAANAAPRPAAVVARADPGRLVLARLLSTLFGLLVGFVLAGIISQNYTGNFREKLDKGREQRAALISSIEQNEPERQRAISELSDVTSKLERILKAERESSPPPNVGASKAELNASHDRLKRELAGYTQDKQELAFLEKSLPEYEAEVKALNISSIAVIVILSVLGFALHPLLAISLDRQARLWEQVYGKSSPRSPQVLVGFFAGMILGVVILLAIFTSFSTAGTLLDYPLVRLILGTVLLGGFGLAGSLTAVSYFLPAGSGPDPYREYRLLSEPKLLDTSVLIDGRVHEIAASGFLDGCLVVSNSVLRELQALADSSDGRKRAKGRRGLELVRAMQEDPRISLRVLDDSAMSNGAHGTDEALILQAHEMGGVVVTNDYNLNRVAAIRDVRVININGLANAVKTSVIPGEMLEIEIMDRGKQRGQGVGYLPDGTMVVVEDGESHIKETRIIKVTSVTQTAQGRLIFGRVDLAEEEAGHA